MLQGVNVWASRWYETAFVDAKLIASAITWWHKTGLCLSAVLKEWGNDPHKADQGSSISTHKLHDRSVSQLSTKQEGIFQTYKGSCTWVVSAFEIESYQHYGRSPVLISASCFEWLPSIFKASYDPSTLLWKGNLIKTRIARKEPLEHWQSALTLPLANDRLLQFGKLIATWL